MSAETLSKQNGLRSCPTSQVIPILTCFSSLVLNWSLASRMKPHKDVCYATKCNIINDVKLFPTVYCRIYCPKLLALSNQTSRYKSKCIRMYSLTVSRCGHTQGSISSGSALFCSSKYKLAHEILVHIAF